jgi:polar amino acid transport system substrate-binding protein
MLNGKGIVAMLTNTTVKNPCVFFLLFFLVGFCFPCELSADELSRVANTDKRIIVATHDVDRMSFQKVDGYRDGWDIRIARYVLGEFGYSEQDIEFISVGVDEKFDTVISGDARFYIGAATLTCERESIGDFSIPHLSIPYGLVVKIENPGLFAKIFAAVKRTIGWLFHPTFWTVILVLLLFLLLKALTVTIIEKKETSSDTPFWKLFAATLWWVECTFCNFNADSGDFVPKGRLARAAATGFTVLLILVGVNYIHVSMTHIMREYPNTTFADMDITGMHLGTKGKTTSVNFAHEMGASVESFTNIQLALSALDDGNVDAVLYDAITLKALLESHPKKKGYRLVYATEFGLQYYGAFFTDDDPMLEQWNRAILNIPAPLIAEWNQRFLK